MQILESFFWVNNPILLTDINNILLYNFIVKDDDYIPGPYYITLPAGRVSVVFNISIVDDTVVDGHDIVFNLAIEESSLPNRVRAGGLRIVAVNINDDDEECK